MFFTVGDNITWTHVSTFREALEIFYWFQSLDLPVTIKNGLNGKVIFKG